MSNFTQFKQRFQANFEDMIKDADHLYEIEVDKDEFWNLYLDSFPAGTNPIFRERSEHDCSCCRHFIKNVGNAVVIKGNKVRTMWDFDTKSETYQPVVDALNAYLLSKTVTDLYLSPLKKVGTDKNYEECTDGKIYTWEHFYLELPDRFVERDSIGTVKGQFRDIRNVFKRSLDEITEDSVLTVLELIASNSLYKGEEWKSVLEKFLEYKRLYAKTPDEEKSNFAWEQSSKAGTVIGKIRNHSIGTLLVDISEDIDLDTAVRKYETIVAPSNYKRPKAIYTKKMLEDAKKTIEDLGYMESLGRRFATLDDITVNNILFSNKDAAKRISGGTVFDEMMSETAISPKKFSKVEEVPVEKFISDILPTARGLEVLLENKHTRNFVSLIAPKDAESKTMFKWNNGFSWAYTGNMTDSDMKQNVKAAGGKVDGVLRFSIQWNDKDGHHDENDVDAHCLEPNKNEIYYGNRFSFTGGNLDIDIRHPAPNKAAVENITWPTLNGMKRGTYVFAVHCFANRGGRSGFKAEIEFSGEIHEFVYDKPLKHGEMIRVADVTLNADDTFTLKNKLPSTVSSKEVWGLKTNQFVPVSVMMYSPNYWDEQQGIGNKHYMFMLKDCVNPEQPNGFYNEFLKQELVQHKRVFEALGSKMAVESVDDQLSGLGFSSTVRNDVIVKVKGSTERVLKIKF